MVTDKLDVVRISRVTGMKIKCVSAKKQENTDKYKNLIYLHAMSGTRTHGKVRLRSVFGWFSSHLVWRFFYPMLQNWIICKKPLFFRYTQIITCELSRLLTTSWSTVAVESQRSYLKPVFSGAGDWPQCSLLFSAKEDRGARRWLACPSARGLDVRIITRAVHELTGILQRSGAGCSSHGPLPAPGLPPQRLSCTCHGPCTA